MHRHFQGVSLPAAYDTVAMMQIVLGLLIVCG
jgi:hypothetical protein